MGVVQLVGRPTAGEQVAGQPLSLEQEDLAPIHRYAAVGAVRPARCRDRGRAEVEADPGTVPGVLEGHHLALADRDQKCEEST